MRCPSCGSELTTSTAEGVRFERCAACRGVAVAVSVLRRFAPEDRVRRLWIELPSGKPSRACPSCTRPMRETKIAAGAESLAIDVCRTCQLVWFDASELARFSPERQAPAPRTDRLSPEAAEALYLAEAEAAQNLERAERQATAISTGVCLAFGHGLIGLALLKRLSDARSGRDA